MSKWTFIQFRLWPREKYFTWNRRQSTNNFCWYLYWKITKIWKLEATWWRFEQFGWIIYQARVLYMMVARLTVRTSMLVIWEPKKVLIRISIKWLLTISRHFQKHSGWIIRSLFLIMKPDNGFGKMEVQANNFGQFVLPNRIKCRTCSTGKYMKVRELRTTPSQTWTTSVPEVYYSEIVRESLIKKPKNLFSQQLLLHQQLFSLLELLTGWLFKSRINGLTNVYQSRNLSTGTAGWPFEFVDPWIKLTFE